MGQGDGNQPEAEGSQGVEEKDEGNQGNAQADQPVAQKESRTLVVERGGAEVAGEQEEEPHTVRLVEEREDPQRQVGQDLGRAGRLDVVKRRDGSVHDGHVVHNHQGREGDFQVVGKSQSGWRLRRCRKIQGDFFKLVFLGRRALGKGDQAR